MLPPLIACVIAAAFAVEDLVPAPGTPVATVGVPIVPVHIALSGQHATSPASSRVQLVFLGQQAKLFRLEQSLAHFESRRKRSRLIRPLY